MFFIYLIVAYLIGSIPFGLVLTKLAGLGDIRAIGSGNIGATNVLRTGRKGLAFLTLLLDSGKGAFTVLAAMILSPYAPDALLLIGLAAILGHCYPIYLKFKGGKGVATTLGTLLAAIPAAGAAACLTWLIAAIIFRISSLSALIAMLMSVVITFLYYGVEAGLVMVAIAAVVFWKHRANIQRIRNSQEPRISFLKKE